MRSTAPLNKIVEMGGEKISPIRASIGVLVPVRLKMDKTGLWMDQKGLVWYNVGAVGSAPHREHFEQAQKSFTV